MMTLPLHDIENLAEYVDSLYVRVITLEDIIDDMHAEQSERIRIPHRCPICNGATMDFDAVACMPCDGKGIVWG